MPYIQYTRFVIICQYTFKIILKLQKGLNVTFGQKNNEIF